MLGQEELALPPTWLLLMRLQHVEAADPELRDMIALLSDHEVSVGSSPERIDAALITALCADDWGWYRTATKNLDRLRFLGSWGRLPGCRNLRDRIEGLHQMIARSPKGVRWQMLARVGDSVRWYKTPLQAQDAAGAAGSP